MSLSALIKSHEKTFNGAVKLKHFFVPAPSSSDHLIIIFSGFNGNEATGVKAKYNYVKHLNYVNCHRLFILDDYNGVPCYYLGKNNTLDYEATVISLITYISNQYKISHSKIIACGSSKGGTAAIYFTMKYNLGYAIAGGMQTNVGDYIYTHNYTKKHVLPLITGGNSDEDRIKLNDFYYELFNTTVNKSTFHIHVGNGDTHYLDHVIPFVEILKRREISHSLDVKEYNGHSELGTYFGEFLLEKLAVVTDSPYVKDIEILKSDQRITITPRVTGYNSDKIEFAYYLYNDNEKVPFKKVMYSNNNLVFDLKPLNVYRVKIFIKNDQKTTSYYLPTIKA